MSQPLVFHDLRSLRQSGLVTGLRSGDAVTCDLVAVHVSHVVAGIFPFVMPTQSAWSVAVCQTGNGSANPAQAVGPAASSASVSAASSRAAASRSESR